jgi:hypothetical protein
MEGENESIVVLCGSISRNAPELFEFGETKRGEIAWSSIMMSK